MPILASEREDILELVVLMFDAAPGPFLDDIVSIYEAVDGDMAQLANILGSTGVFQALHPNFQTAEEFAADFLSTVGLEDDAVAVDWVIGALESGMTKAEIMYVAWNFLDNLPATWPQQYQDAKAIMDNKADVSEVYSVELRGGATSVGELQDVLDGVDETDASVDAAIDRIEDELAEGPTLTTGVDTINVSGIDGAVNIAGVVDGDADGNTNGSTFSAGDRITGNGNSNLNLTVVEAGDADFAFVDNMEAINIVSGLAPGSTITFVGAEWDNVDAIVLEGGVDGLEVEVNLLETGVDLVIDTDVAGTLDIVYDDGMRAVLWNTGDGGVSLIDGNVVMNAEEAASAGIWFSGAADVVVGTVTGTGVDGAELYFSADLTGGADLTAGDITMTVGDESGGSDWVSVSLSVTGDGGDIAVGNINLTGGDGVGAIVDLFADGDVTVGNVDLTAGDSGSAWMSVTAEGEITVANVVQMVGDSASATFHVYGDAGVTIGDISQTVGATASMSISITSSGTGTEDIVVGDIAQVGATSVSAYIQIDNNQGGGDIMVGQISQTVGDSASVTVSVSSDSSGDIHVGGIAQVAGDSADLNAWIYADGGGNVHAGDISQSAGDSATLSVSVTASDVGTINVGDISQVAGDSGYAYVNVSGETGDVSVAGISVAVGASGSMDVNVSNTGSGDVTIGDITLSVGDWTTTATSNIELDVFNGGGGDLSIGNMSIDVGLSGSADVEISNTADADESQGSLSVGNVSVTLADNADVAINITNTQTVTADTDSTAVVNVGAMSVGQISVLAGTGAAVDISISQGLWDGGGIDGGSVGDVNLDGFEVTAGVNADVSIDVSISNTAGGDVGNVTVGDMSFNLDDGGYLSVDFDISADGDVGDVTFGDITAIVGVSGSIDSISIEIDGDNIGNVAIGDLWLEVGQFASQGDVSISVSASGDIESFVMGDLTVMVGQSADGTEVSITLDASGNIGDVTFGDVTAVYGVNASADLYDVSISASGDIGAIVFGDFNVTLETGAYVSDMYAVDINAANIESLTIGDYMVTIGESASKTSYDYLDVSATGNIGNVTLGNVAYSLTGAGAYTSDGVSRTVDAGGTLGNVTVGNISMIAMTDTSFTSDWDFTFRGDLGVGDVVFGDVTMAGTDVNDSLSLNLYVSATSGDVGSLTIGNIDLSIEDPSSDVNFEADVWASGALGAITIGDVSLSAVGASASALADISATASGSFTGDVTIGDIALMASASGYASFSFDLNGATFDGAISVGEISFDLTASASAGVWIDGNDGDITIAGIRLVETDVAADLVLFSDYWLSITGDAVTIQNISFDVVAAAGAYEPSDVLGGISATSITLGTVDYSGYDAAAAGQAGEDIDLSAYEGNLTVIGTARGDTITGNTDASETTDYRNTFTGGAGTDTFVVDDMGLDATTSATADDRLVTITDFKAGDSFGELLDVDPAVFAVAWYAEKTATSFAEFVSVAIAAMTNAEQEADIVAVQVGGNTYVAIDSDGGDNIDSVILLTGVTTAQLNFADFT